MNHDPIILNESKRCRVGLEPLGSFNEIQPSTYHHISAKIAASECKYRSLRGKIEGTIFLRTPPTDESVMMFTIHTA